MSASISLPYTQDDFSGGMNLLDIDTKLAPNQYRVGVNIRTRFGPAQPVKNVVEIIEGLPEDFGSPQGLYAFGNILVLFIRGQAWFKTTTNDEWSLIADLQMNLNVERIYCCAVPQATLVYNRLGGAKPSDAVTLDTTATTANPVCLVVQDGITQPWLIFPDGTARVSKTYAQWTTVDREYVPVGLQMVHFNGILFVVSPDSKRVYRSVTGRPLDFAVAVDAAGDIVSDATNTSFAVDSNEIKLIAPLNAESLIIITAYTATAVLLNQDRLLYDEPTFNFITLFSAGASNQFSFGDILGDFTFIDKEGLKSFNAVTQLKFEGNNSVFSLSVAELFKGIVQSNPCLGSFDNYTLFSVKTTYGPNSILVFDNIKKVFVSIDLLTPQPIKQFAVTYTANEQRCFVITNTSVYELYSPDADDYADAIVFTRALNSRNSDLGPTKTLANVRTERLKVQFSENATEDAIVNISEVVNENNQDTSSITKTLPVYTGGVSYPVTAPVMSEVTNYLIPLDLVFKGPEGQKISYIILWTGGSKLSFAQISLACKQAPITKQQQETIFSS